MARQMFRVNLDFVDRHTRLIHNRQQIEAVSALLTKLTQATPGSAQDRLQFSAISGELGPGGAPAPFLLDAGRDLPAESAEVQQAFSALSAAWKAARKPGRRPSEFRRGAAESAAIGRLRLAIDTLQSGTDRLDDASFGRFQQIQGDKWAALGLVALNWLLILIAFGDAVQLYRRLRKEELARFGIESELAAERRDLEKNVQARTAALEAEVKERQRAERLNSGRNHALEMLTRNEDSADILQVLANTVAEYRSTWLCAFHSLESGSLKLVASSGLNEKLIKHFRSISADFVGAPESVAMASGKPHVILDLGAERRPWSELLRAIGLLSVWSAPFYAPNAGALGTLTVYTRMRWEPSTADIEMLEMACHMAALVLERSHLQIQLVEHAYHDSLTGLPNRRLGRDRLASAIARAARSNIRVAVLWLDLDRFKQINDRHGHPFGDSVLQQTARRLTSRLRASDTLARMGGDEFLAILEGIDSRDQAESVGVQLLSALRHPMMVGETEIAVSASIGVSLFPDDGKTVDSLAQCADRAMYAAKFASCGVLSFSAEMDQEPAERRELELELSRGIEMGWFSLAYQPVCLPDGALVGFEALVRFTSPSLGSIPPSRFIPIAEEMRLILPLGEWVLREACRQSQKWRRSGFPRPSIAVNISALQFARDDVAETVARILVDSGVAGEDLVLEITESIVMRDFSESARQLNRLKRYGVRIAIDDFGTGYSSLSSLHRLPIDVLKIDRSFIQQLNEPDGTRPIVEAVISMAHTLGLCVVAEGVETDVQLNTLRQLGCDRIQGYYFSRPVDPAAAAAWLRAGKLEGGVIGAPPLIDAYPRPFRLQ